MELTDLCVELNNYFETSRYFGKFTIAGGSIDLSELVASGSLQSGQYFRIAGSVFNDGVYKYPATELKDEVFDGAIWPMAVPTAAMGLLSDINAWLNSLSDEDKSAINSPFQSESFGGYSYSKGSNNSGSGASADLGSWQNQFRSRLNKWRKIRAV